MAGDEDIVKRLVQLLENADLDTTTPKVIRSQLELEFGMNLSHKKGFIGEQIDLFLNQQQQHYEENESEKGGATEEEVPGNRGRKSKESNGCESNKEEVNPKRKRGSSAAASEVVDSKRLRAKIGRAIKESMVKEKKKRVSGGGGLNKNCCLSPGLQAILGKEELPRTQVVKQLWEYIRQNNLQDPENRRNIICDDALRALFGTDRTDIFKMHKLLSKHVWPIEDAS